MSDSRRGSAARAGGADEADRHVHLDPGSPAFLSKTAAAEINAEHLAATGKAREAIEHARRAGEMLLDVKAGLGHGAFLPWLAANITFSDRTAQRYMVLAENWPAIAAKSDTLSDLTIRGALRAIAKPRQEPEHRELDVREVDVPVAAPAPPKGRHPALKGTHYRRPNREIERAIIALDGICDLLETIKLWAIDNTKATEWATELKRRGATINRFARRLDRKAAP